MKAKEKKQIFKAIEKSDLNFDSWSNILTGLGVMGKDKRLAATPFKNVLTQQDLEDLYEADDMAERICDRIPFDGTREWVEHTNLNPDEKRALNTVYKKLRVSTNFRKAWQWGRLYGGAAILIALDDGMDWQEPVDFSRIKRIKNLLVVNRFELYAQPLPIKDIFNPAFGLPEFYRISTPGGQENISTGQQIHHTRVIRFEGAPIPRRSFIQHNYWSASILQRVREILGDYNQCNSAVAAIIQDFRQSVLKIPKLSQLILAGQTKQIMDRLNTFNTTRSILNTAVIDTDEDWKVDAPTLTGLVDLVDRISNRLVAATGMPHTIILGESPSGLGANGRSEQQDYFDHVRHQQESVCRDPLDYLHLLISSAKDYNFHPAEEWSFNFKPLFQMSDMDRATFKKTVADGDAIYLDRGVLTPEEVAEGRFGGDVYSDDIKLDPDRMDEPNESTDPNAPVSVKGTLSPLTTPPGGATDRPTASPKKTSTGLPSGNGTGKV